MTLDLYKGENLIIQYDRREDEAPDRLYWGSTVPNSPWYIIDLEKAKAIRDALDKGISLLESKNDLVH